MAAKVVHCGLENDLHMSLYNPAATFSHLLCLHNLRKRLSERDRNVHAMVAVVAAALKHITFYEVKIKY